MRNKKKLMNEDIVVGKQFDSYTIKSKTAFVSGLKAKDLELIAYRLLGYALNEQSKPRIIDINPDGDTDE